MQFQGLSRQSEFLGTTQCRSIEQASLENSRIGQEIDHFKSSRFEPFYQPLWGVWLFKCSSCGRIVQNSSRKDKQYQNYYNSTTALPNWHYCVIPSGWPALKVKCAPKFPTYLNASLIYFGPKNHQSKYSSPSVFVIPIESHQEKIIMRMSNSARFSG